MKNSVFIVFAAFALALPAVLLAQEEKGSGATLTALEKSLGGQQPAALASGSNTLDDASAKMGRKFPPKVPRDGTNRLARAEGKRLSRVAGEEEFKALEEAAFDGAVSNAQKRARHGGPRNAARLAAMTNGPAEKVLSPEQEKALRTLAREKAKAEREKDKAERQAVKAQREFKRDQDRARRESERNAKFGRDGESGVKHQDQRRAEMDLEREKRKQQRKFDSRKKAVEKASGVLSGVKDQAEEEESSSEK